MHARINLANADQSDLEAHAIQVFYIEEIRLSLMYMTSKPLLNLISGYVAM